MFRTLYTQNTRSSTRPNISYLIKVALKDKLFIEINKGKEKYLRTQFTAYISFMLINKIGVSSLFVMISVSKL